MISEQLKNWIKDQDPNFVGRIQLGGVDGNAAQYLGVYPGKSAGRQPMAIGGPELTSYGVYSATLLLRWSKSQPEAERKARALWNLFYGQTAFDMDGVSVSFADPGPGPVWVGKGADGTFEYVINLNITYMKE